MRTAVNYISLLKNHQDHIKFLRGKRADRLTGCVPFFHSGKKLSSRRKSYYVSVWFSLVESICADMSCVWQPTVKMQSMFYKTVYSGIVGKWNKKRGWGVRGIWNNRFLVPLWSSTCLYQSLLNVFCNRRQIKRMALLNLGGRKKNCCCSCSCSFSLTIQKTPTKDNSTCEQEQPSPSPSNSYHDSTTGVLQTSHTALGRRWCQVEW